MVDHEFVSKRLRVRGLLPKGHLDEPPGWGIVCVAQSSRGCSTAEFASWPRCPCSLVGSDCSHLASPRLGVARW